MAKVEERTETGLEIAVIGMSCRFPGANNVGQYWDNLAQGKDCISRFSLKEMLDSGVPRHMVERANYVRAKGVVSGVESFDAEFFDYSPREATCLDPQARLIHECVWEALENAGYCSQPHAGSVGLYVGGSTDQAWLEMLLMRGEMSAAERMETGLLGFKDSISTLTSYKLGLNGPSFTIYTACSTSALSVHLACRALLTGDCDIAAAGGASVYLPVRKGYLYEEGLTSSPDGKIRPFDENAGGALFSDGAGIVVLKRYADAVSDGDHIHAVILGTASNNDGGRSVGYTAPSIDGQADVISKAQEFAEVSPASISYIETHGTATQIGDTIEFEALKRVFPDDIRGACALGSVKSNIGHLDTASGVASLIKVILALKHAQIPPTINFERPNPKINLIESPFYVAGELEDWDRPVRRAGVSSFGFGGTNVHMILEAPPKAASEEAGHRSQLIPISARSETALQAALLQAHDYFKAANLPVFADACYTFQVGRKAFEYRATIVASDAEQASDLLVRALHADNGQAVGQNRNPTLELEIGDVSWLLPVVLSALEPGTVVGTTLLELVDEIDGNEGLGLSSHKGRLLDYDATDHERVRLQAVLVAASLGRSLQRLGLRISAVHTFGDGDLAAAIITGRASVTEALGALLGAQSAEVLKSRPSPFPIFTIEAEAAARSAGPAEARKRDRPGKASNSSKNVLRLRLCPSPAAAGLDKGNAASFFERCQDLSLETEFLRLVGFCWRSGSDIRWDALHSGRRRRVPLPTYPFQKQRLWLPDRLRSGVEVQTEKLERMADWFTEPGWKKTAPAEQVAHESSSDAWLVFHDSCSSLERLIDVLHAHSDHLFVVADDKAADCLAANDRSVASPDSVAQFSDAIDRALKVGATALKIVHATSLTTVDPAESFETGLGALVSLIKAIAIKDPKVQFQISVLTNCATKVAHGDTVVPEKRAMLAPVKVAPQEHPNIRGRLIDIDQDTLQADAVETGLLNDLACSGGASEIAYRAKQRFERTYEPVRGIAKLTTALDWPDGSRPGKLKRGGVYLITGGLGVVGLTIARYLAREYSANIALLGRSGLPDREKWADVVATTDESDQLGFRIRQVMGLENVGARVKVLAVDVCDQPALEEAVTSIEEDWGPINGVIHAAGILRVKSAQTPIVGIGPRDFEEQIRPKLDGLRSLSSVFEARPLDFRIAVSSLSPILGGLGHVAYAAANLAMDGFVADQDEAAGVKWLGVAWNDWHYVGPSFDSEMRKSSILELSMTEREAEQTLECATALSTRREVVISTGYIEDRIKQWVNPEISAGPARTKAAKPSSGPSPAAQFKGIASTTEIKRFLVSLCREFFDVQEVDSGTNLFELGATSLHIVQLHTRVIDALGRHVPIAMFFEHPTIALLAEALTSGESAYADEKFDGATHQPSTAVAIIGMAGRFPGADNVDEFWRNIDAGVCSIRFFDRETLLAAGVPRADVDRPDYVPAKGYLSGCDEFDSHFFDYTPHDVSIMDPQLRVFHECAWSAFEHAGYAIRSYSGSVGVFAGASPNLYWQAQSMLGQLSEQASSFEAAILSDKDSLSTQISYKFNLSGPSVTVFTGCSTSLVAVEAAYRAIVNGECDICLAGGVTVSEPGIKGYIYEPGMAYSKDGYCRPFDDDASGMVFGDGVGAIILKSLEKAIKDGDTIHAVIRGCAVNNDGRRKVGYTAPSVDGQADVMRLAYLRAGIEPASVGYIETHGTGTKLGDVVEAAAIKKAFGQREPLPIGSVKSQVGHLNAAAGVTGVIKAVQMLKNKVLPASLHFETPNKQCEFEGGPIYVNATRSEWPEGPRPLRIGVNSFGIGGTNAHAILEEPPALAQRDTDIGSEHVITLSAATASALDRSISNLASFLRDYPSTDLGDLAYTLQVGRENFAHRKAFACTSSVEALSILDSRQGAYASTCKDALPVVFMFSGNGGEYVHMAKQYYNADHVFAYTLDKCLSLAEACLGEPLKPVLYPSTPDEQRDAERLLQEMRYNQPIIFSIEYAMAMLLNSWGVRPSALIGYSLGEYVAATLAGVFNLEEAIKIVCTRGHLLAQLHAGAMLSVPLDETECARLIDELKMRAQLSIAIDNGPSCIVSGEIDHIGAFEKCLKLRKILSMRVRTSIAAHSHLTQTITQEFRKVFEGVALHTPNMTVFSGITGDPLTDDQAKDAEYWIAHLHSPIRFVRGVQKIADAGESIFVEVGPGRDLAILARRTCADLRALWTISPQKHSRPDQPVTKSKLAELWANGVDIDWASLHANHRRLRIPLPTYPFEKLKHRSPSPQLSLANGPLAALTGVIEKAPDISDWFFAREWESLPNLSSFEFDAPDNVLVMSEKGSDLGEKLAAVLSERGAGRVVILQPGEAVLGDSGRSIVFHPGQAGHYLDLFKFLDEEDLFPDTIIDCRSVVMGRVRTSNDSSRGNFYAALRLIKAVAERLGGRSIDFLLVTNRSQSVFGTEKLVPINATLVGLSLVARQEIAGLRIAAVDLEDLIVGAEDIRRAADHVVNVYGFRNWPALMACRGSRVWQQRFKPAPLPPAANPTATLRKNGTYLITGGLGGIGQILAEYLARNYQAKLVLTARPFSESCVQGADGDIDEKTASHRAFAAELERLGAQVRIEYANVADEKAMRGVLKRTVEYLGALNGVIHAAGLPSGDTFELIKDITEDQCDRQFEAKQSGTIVLHRLLAQHDIDFALAMSSISTVLGGLGFAGYAPANLFMNTFLSEQAAHSSVPWISVDWSDWKYWIEDDLKDAQIGQSVRSISIEAMEGIDCFERILACGRREVVHSPGDLAARIARWVDRSLDDEEAMDPAFFEERPELLEPYAEPASELELKLAGILCEVFRIKMVGVNDDFFDLGGDSLKGVTAVTRIHKQVGVQIPLTQLFETPTISGLVGYIESIQGSELQSIPKAPTQESYDLSAAQRRIYVLHQLFPDSTAYNDPMMFLVEGVLDVSRVKEVFDRIIQRHDSLRTSFQIIDDEPRQVILEDLAISIDYRKVDEIDVANAIRDFVRPFDLAHAPLMRTALFEIAQARHVLLIDLHHIITDGVSSDRLMRDFVALYRSMPLPALRLQYKDFSEWQRSEAARDIAARQQPYWLATLADPSEPATFPPSRVGPEVASYSGSSIAFELAAPLFEKLKKQVQSEGVTLFTGVMAAFKALLARYSGQTDLVVGTPVSGRLHPDLEGIVGMFVNMLPVRTKYDGRASFRTLLSAVGKNLAGAIDHQMFQYEELLRALNVHGSLRKSPLFKVVIVQQRMDADHIELEDLKISPYQTDLRRALFDLVLNVFETPRGVTLTLDYATDLYDRAMMEGLVEQFCAFIASLVARPDDPIDAIEIGETLQAAYAAGDAIRTRNLAFED